MSVAALGGLLAGLATIAISEILLRFWGTSARLESYWKLWLAGLGLRAAWILGLLALILVTRWLEPKPFTLALLGGYLAAQVLEGFRYQRFLRTR